MAAFTAAFAAKFKSENFGIDEQPVNLFSKIFSEVFFSFSH